MNSSNIHQLGLSSLVYVSRSTLALDGDAQAVNEIACSANARNAHLGVTGALLYTELHFAQLARGQCKRDRHVDDKHSTR